MGVKLTKYGLLGTCKALGIDTYTWLTDILLGLPSQPMNRIKELLLMFYRK
jgi:hypothetical protein